MSQQPPRRIYDALTKAGASTTQAIGIMANMINESGFDPEAVNSQDPNGGSFGLVQENGSQYSGLVTGNDQNDIQSQITLLAQQGGFAAANGSTIAAAAGNFAANYERCKECQPGGQQYNSRVDNANTVSGWVVTGKWPQSAGSPSSSGSGAGGSGGGSSPQCLVPSPFASLPLIGGGAGCVFTRTQARALVGGLLLAGSGFVFLVGSLVLASYGLKGTAAGRAAGNAAGAAAGAIPITGAPITATRKAASGVRRAAGRRSAGRREVAGLRASGASDLRTARQKPGTLTRTPGRGRRIESRTAQEIDRDRPPF